MRLILFSLIISIFTTSCHSLAMVGRGALSRGAAMRGLASQAGKQALKNQKKPKKRGNQLGNLNRAQDLIELANNASAGDEENRNYQSAAETDRGLRARGIDTRGFKYGPQSPSGARFIYGTPDRSPTGATFEYPKP